MLRPKSGKDSESTFHFSWQTCTCSHCNGLFKFQVQVSVCVSSSSRIIVTVRSYAPRYWLRGWVVGMLVVNTRDPVWMLYLYKLSNNTNRKHMGDPVNDIVFIYCCNLRLEFFFHCIRFFVADLHTHKLDFLPCSIKAGILRRGWVESCKSFVLEQLPLLLLNR